MSVRYDDKGKYFTELVNKDAVPVVIQTMTNVIRGNIHVIPGRRVKDEISRLEEFFAVTEATVYSAVGKELYHCKFMTVNRDKVVWLLPETEIQPISSGDTP